MTKPLYPKLYHGNRLFSQGELQEIIDTVNFFPRLARVELAETICEHLGWFTPTGTYKRTACLKLLERLEKDGFLSLPVKRNLGPTKDKPVQSGEGGVIEEPPSQLEGVLKDLGRVDLELVEGKARHQAWKQAVARYHYLGYKRPFGCVVRYFIVTAHGPAGCLQYAGASRSVAVRDQWLGWTRHQRMKNLGWVSNNNRFVIFSWLKIRNLASHVLGQASRRIGDDWERLWGYRPVLLETFVDPAYYRGSSYRGAGWLYLGMTTGHGLVRSGRQYETSPKMLFVYPLQPDFREVLCSDNLTGRVFE